MSSNGALRASQKYFTCLGKVFLRLIEAAFLLTCFFFFSSLPFSRLRDSGLFGSGADRFVFVCFKLHRNRLSPLTMVL